MHQTFASLSLLAVSLALTGCASEPPTPTEAYARIERAVCSSYAQCQPDFHGFDASIVAHGLTGDCSGLGESDPLLELLLARGRVRVDEERLTLCEADLRRCRYQTPNCDLALVGTQPEGAACIDSLECASANCSGNRYLGTCGVCEAPFLGIAALGEPCYQSTICAQADGMTVVCNSPFDGHCAIEHEVGRGEACAVDAPCKAGLFCGRDRVCVPAIALGAACVAGETCVHGGYCTGNDADEAGATGICVSVEVVGEGASCVSVDHYRWCDQSRELYCDGSVCVRHVLSKLGGACRSGFDCADERPCVDSVCSEPLPVGASCITDSDCETARCELDSDARRVCAEELPMCE